MATAVKHSTGNAVDYTPGSDVAAGAVVVQFDMLGIAPDAIAANVKGALEIEGIWKLPLEPAVDFGAGQDVYWDETNQYLTKTANGWLWFGKMAVAAAAAAAATAFGYAKLCHAPDTSSYHSS